jgi:hypothetical protein
MESRKYALRTFGIDTKKVPGINKGLTYDEMLLLEKIRECRRRVQYVSKRLPGEDFEIDEELSNQCCSHGWN